MDPALENDWDTNDLYEKRRVKERRKLFLILGLAFSLFLALCSVPVVKERSPKWKTLRFARQLSVQIEKMKTLSIQRREALVMRILETGELQVVAVKNCEDAEGRLVSQNAWIDPTRVQVVRAEEAARLELSLVTDRICFDPVYGVSMNGDTRRLFVIVPVNDLTQSRMDRASYVVLDGESAKISIN